MQEDLDNEQYVSKTKTTETEPQGVQSNSIDNEPRAEQADRPRQESQAAQNERYPAPTAVRSTVTDTSTRHEPAWSATGVRIVAFILGIIEVFLILRLILKLLIASTSSLFVRFIYSVTDVLLLPFSGIFTDTVDTGVGAESVFEPAVLVAMLVYALVAWGFVKLIMIFRRKNTS